MAAHAAHSHIHHSNDTVAPAGDVKDPVCGMTIDPHTANHRYAHNGYPYYFCSSGCREKFIADAARYLQAEARAAQPLPAGTIYTCPMHPEIRQPGPGSCPICGMALEPEIVSADTQPNAELADMTRRFWDRARADASRVCPRDGRPLDSFAAVARPANVKLASAVSGNPCGAVGRLAILRARMGLPEDAQSEHVHADRHGHWRGLGLQRHRHPVARLVSALDAGHGGSVAIFFEAAAVITVLVLLGQVLELRAREQTSGAIRALLDLSPKMARRIGPDGTDEDMSLDQVVVGDRLRVHPGERVPVDGEIVEGRSAIDKSMVTGKSMPGTKSVADKVIGGTMNQSGAFIMRADKVGRDTVLSQIVQMVAAAQRSRAPIQRLADQVSAWFVPTVILVAVLA